MIDMDKIEKPEVFTLEGSVTTNPVHGENSTGKRSCLFTVQTDDGMDVNLYTVKYRDECIRLVAGDRVRVRYVRNGGHNNLVASPEMLEEGDKANRIMTAVENLDRGQGLMARNMSRIVEELSELGRRFSAVEVKLDRLSDLVEELNAPYDECGDNQYGTPGQ